MIYSYSSIATYKQCPLKFKFAYIDRIKVEKRVPSPAMERGSKIHDSVESFIKGTTEYLHPDIHKNYGQFIHGIRENNVDVRPEFKWGITWEFKPCTYDDPAAMVHGYIDLLVVPEPEQALGIYEWKTGGKYDEHASQVHLYSVAMLCHFPEHQSADAMITYFDKVDYKALSYPRSMMFEYKPMIRNMIGQIADETRFPAKSSFKCKWCDFSRYNGGPCPVS